MLASCTCLPPIGKSCSSESSRSVTALVSSATWNRCSKWRTSAATALAADVRHFEQRFHVADETSAVTERLLSLLQDFPIGGKQVHDANIVATMQTYGIQRLLTANVADFARFGQLIAVIPLE